MTEVHIFMKGDIQNVLEVCVRNHLFNYLI